MLLRLLIGYAVITIIVYALALYVLVRLDVIFYPPDPEEAIGVAVASFSWPLVLVVAIIALPFVIVYFLVRKIAEPKD